MNKDNLFDVLEPARLSLALYTDKKEEFKSLKKALLGIKYPPFREVCTLFEKLNASEIAIFRLCYIGFQTSVGILINTDGDQKAAKSAISAYDCMKNVFAISELRIEIDNFMREFLV